MKQKFSEIIRRFGALRYPLIVVGAILASACIAATVFAADIDTVGVNYKGQITEITCHEGTVNDALKAAGIILTNNDKINCDSETALSAVQSVEISDKNDTILFVPGKVYTFPQTHGTAIDYALEMSDRSGLDILSDEERRVAEATPTPSPAPVSEVKNETEYWDVDFKTDRRPDDTMYEGQTKTIREGEKGQRQVDYIVKYSNGKVVSKEVTSDKVIKEPVNKIVAYGTMKSTQTDKGKNVAYSKVYRNFSATGYSWKEPDNIWGRSTSYGILAQDGVIAVDKSIIKLGTKVYVEGVGGVPDYGYAIAADTGNAIKGNKVDLHIEDLTAMHKWGRKNVNIYILEDQSVNIFDLRNNDV